MARTTAFLRYLPAFGYRCQVLTTSAFGGEDDVLRAWEPLSLYRWLFNRQVRNGEGNSAVRTRRGLLSRIGRAFFIPDLQISWLPMAFASGLRYLRGHDCDLIYTSFPPASAHLLGYLLQRTTGLPWVADFRDAWIFDPLDVYLEGESLRKCLEERIEERVIASASAVVVASQEVADYLCTRYASHAAKVRVISNGFDGALPNRSRPFQGMSPMRLIHAGSFSYSHPRRSPKVLFDALERLLQEDAQWDQRLNVVLVGLLSEQETAWADSLVRRGIVQVEGVVERDRALEIQESAHVLLVVDHMRPWTSTNVPSKVYEYLAQGRPILSLGGCGAVGRIVTELQAGIHVPGDNADAVCAALKSLCNEHERGILPVGASEEALRPFHRRSLTRALAECFDSVIQQAVPCK